MTILETLIQLRDDLKTWVTNNLVALNNKIEEKTIPVDTKLSSTSVNPVQNKIITKEINDLNDLVGTTPVAEQISNAIANQPEIELPDITDDESGELVIADPNGNIIMMVDEDGLHTTNVDAQSISTDSEDWTIEDPQGNIIFKVDENGAHTTAMKLNGKAAATQEYVDEKVATIKIPDVDFTGYATEEYVDDAVATAKSELSESIESTGEDWTIADESGNIILKVDAEGVHTTAMQLGGETAATEKYVDEQIAKIPATDLSNYYTKTEVDDAVATTKSELSESIVSEGGTWAIEDEEGNIALQVDDNGLTVAYIQTKGMSAEDGTFETIETTNIDTVDAYITNLYLGESVKEPITKIQAIPVEAIEALFAEEVAE